MRDYRKIVFFMSAIKSFIARRKHFLNKRASCFFEINAHLTKIGIGVEKTYLAIEEGKRSLRI